MKYIPGLAALACMGLLASGAAQAINVNFTGKLVEQPDCVLNAGKDIAVDFAEVAVKKIDGVNYKKMEIPYSVSCSGGSPNSGELKVMLEFVGVSWGDYKPLQSSIPNLGLRIVQGAGDTTYVSKTKLVIADPNNPTKLYAVPIGRPGASLVAGDFTGSATMTAMYE
ncbi:fimbrial protein [Serratia ureilytica]|uniref:fimbrial protein n=1 Tax=Serratia ureilytica TaxID=300181 RepID=UPI001D181D55|nr:fimbrial protein [Serratia ureilytica]MCC4106635.1 fimbrial protein [Serratia ureilytica]